MKFRMKFTQNEAHFQMKFGTVNNISDGGFERGYAEGYAEGEIEGAKLAGGILAGTLAEINNSEISYLKKFALAFDATIEKASFENVQSTGEHVFYQCYGLKDVYLPNLTTPGTYVFRECSALESLTLPKVTALQYGLCQSSKKLAYVDASSITSIANAAFLDCAELATLILRNNKVATLAATRAFSGTPIASGTGFVYVPDGLVDSYKAATNWSTYADQIKPLSELGE